MSFQFTTIDNAFLTIITPTYNSSKYILKCLTTLQTACSNISSIFQIAHIVVDGNSSDNTVAIIKQNSPSSLIFFREPNGIYDALNYGVTLVKSSYVMYLHSDDELEDYFLDNMLKQIQHLSPDTPKICYGTVEFIDENSQVIFTRKPPIYISFIQKYVNLIFHPNSIYSTGLEKNYPYEINKGLTADHNHITSIAKVSQVIRIASAKYRFRLSTSSSTLVAIHNRNSSKLKVNNLIASFLKRYLNLFEDELILRTVLKFLYQKSYWK
jgi:glycosyltransferase